MPVKGQINTRVWRPVPRDICCFFIHILPSKKKHCWPLRSFNIANFLLHSLWKTGMLNIASKVVKIPAGAPMVKNVLYECVLARKHMSIGESLARGKTTCYFYKNFNENVCCCRATREDIIRVQLHTIPGAYPFICKYSTNPKSCTSWLLDM